MTMNDVEKAVRSRDSEAAVAAASDMLASGVSANRIYWEGAYAAIYAAEKDAEIGKIGLPVLLQTVKVADAVKEAVKFEKPDLGRAITCTVDSHTDGRNLMALLLGIAGFDVVILEKDRTEIDVANFCAEPDVTVCTASAEFCTPGNKLKTLVQALKDEGVRDKVVFNAGGLPVTHAAAKDLGSDVHSDSAADSVKQILEMVMDRKGIKPF